MFMLFNLANISSRRRLRLLLPLDLDLDLPPDLPLEAQPPQVALVRLVLRVGHQARAVLLLKPLPLPVFWVWPVWLPPC